jgi:hypothetical protein
MGALSELAELYFGGPTRTRVRDVTVTAAAALEVLPEDPDRVAWAMQNRAANFGTYDHTPGVTTAIGFRLAASVGFASKDYRVDGESTGYAVFARQDTADGTWHIEETIRTTGERPPAALTR